MKYTDSWRYKNKSEDFDYEESQRNKTRYRKRRIDKFLVLVPDKIWFKSLEFDIQWKVFNDYYSYKRFNLSNDKFWEDIKGNYPGDKTVN